MIKYLISRTFHLLGSVHFKIVEVGEACHGFATVIRDGSGSAQLVNPRARVLTSHELVGRAEPSRAEPTSSIFKFFLKIFKLFHHIFYELLACGPLTSRAWLDQRVLEFMSPRAQFLKFF